MQDFDAVLADDGPALAQVRTRQLTGATRIVASVGPVVCEPLPGLLDTRYVRTELLRLRGPRGEAPLGGDRRQGA
jgi:hypothetical protein